MPNTLTFLLQNLLLALMGRLHMYCSVVIYLDSDLHLTTIQIYHYNQYRTLDKLKNVSKGGSSSKYLLSSSNGQSIGITFDEIKILAAPMEHFEGWIEFVQ